MKNTFVATLTISFLSIPHITAAVIIYDVQNPSNIETTFRDFNLETGLERQTGQPSSDFHLNLELSAGGKWFNLSGFIQNGLVLTGIGTEIEVISASSTLSPGDSRFTPSFDYSLNNVMPFGEIVYAGFSLFPNIDPMTGNPSGAPQLGWLEFSNTPTGIDFFRWGIETTPNTAIVIGQVPEPSSIFLLTLSFLSLTTRRQR